MTGRPPPEDDDPFIRSLRDAGIRPLGSGRGRRPPPGRRERLALGMAAAVFLLLAGVPAVASRLADWLWFQEIGFERVFVTKIAAQWALGLLAGIAAFVVLHTSVRAALASPRVPEIEPDITQARARPALPPWRPAVESAAGAFAPLAAAVLALLFALVMAAEWRTVLEYWYRTPFGETDPVFGRDVGYYVFTLPLVEVVTDAARLLLTLATLLAVPAYVLRGEIGGQLPRLTVRPRAQRHLAVLAALYLLTTAAHVHFVRVPGLLFGEHLPLSGANYADLHVRLPALRVLAATALLGGLAILAAGLRGRLVPVATRAVVAYLAVALLAGVVPALYQRLVVQPNELARESAQIVHHIRATRRAWGLDAVKSQELGVEARLTTELVARNRETIDNVRLWDREPLLQTFGQIQSIRTYYDFVSVDDDRYRIGGRTRQVLLSPRELNTAALPTRGFINEHLTYTHGMGVTLGPSNAVTSEGLPVLFIKDLPPASSVDVTVTRPQIYYGELANDFVMAPSRQREFDYPAGEGDAAAYSQYDGRGGVGLASFARRLLFAAHFGSLNILLSRDLTPRTRILYNRDVRARAARALPFALLDRDPYMVIAADGRLVWMLDAYTATARFPYAQPLPGGTNYMRNSIKITVDAYHGDVRAYLADPRDPIVRTLAKMYPGLLHPLASMPADLRAHLRYPEDLFRVQTSLYATYHMVDPQTFYHREDQWQIPGGAQAAGPVGPARRAEGEAFLRHMVMRLPGEATPEFILMRPFTPRQKDNLAAWMVARNDAPHYGELAVYRFPRQSLVFGPSQIVNRINQDTEVARQITLWDQRGSEVLRGELLVLPIEGSLIYVQPLYLRAEGGRIPELKRVVVAHQGRVAMAESLDAAIVALLGGAPSEASVAAAESGGTGSPAPAVPPVPAVGAAGAAPAPAADVDGLARQAREHYDRARAAQRADDWATYGEEMRRLGEALRRLEAARGAARP